MSITEIPSTRPALVPVTFDLYRDIHKAIRTELFGLVGVAGQTDPTNVLATADLASQTARLVDFLDLHAEHEDVHIQPLILGVTPEAAERIEADHADFEGIGAELVGRAAEVTDARPVDRRFLVHSLYLDLARFVSDYLAHQDLEERLVMPALEEAFGLDPIMGAHGAILASIPPDEMMRSLALMFPAMNVDDRTELLGGMRATAPAEAFDATWGLVGSVLDPADRAQLAARMGLS